VGIYRDCPNFSVPPIISGTDKATNFKFCTHILSIDQNNSPLKISGALAGCVVRTLETFKCTHILGASRGLLCDSYAVLLQIDRHSAGTVVDYSFTLLTDLVDQATMMASIGLSILPGPDE